MYEKEYNEKDLNELIDATRFECESMCGIW